MVKKQVYKLNEWENHVPVKYNLTSPPPRKKNIAGDMATRFFGFRLTRLNLHCAIIRKMLGKLQLEYIVFNEYFVLWIFYFLRRCFFPLSLPRL
jgi:hypothetical protein